VRTQVRATIEQYETHVEEAKAAKEEPDIGTIFLDRALKVKLFTARTRDIFNLLSADVGRPLSNPVMFKTGACAAGRQV
jgi:two-component system, chemotaxis family, CheB/CheR fusion protein